MAKLRAILEDVGMRRRQPEESFESFEDRVHKQLQDVERELLAEDLAASDVDVPGIMVEGTAYRRVLRAEETYMTAAGPVRVERTLYKDRSDEAERAIVPMELKAGIVGGFWTPTAARQDAWVVSQMTPQTAEELFTRLGHMSPSKSSLDRLPKVLAERWNRDRKGFEDALREAMMGSRGRGERDGQPGRGAGPHEGRRGCRETRGHGRPGSESQRDLPGIAR